MFGTGILDSVATSKKLKPADIEFIHFLFFEHGITLKEFNELPIPYIFSILNTYRHNQEAERKAYEKSSKRK